jgi:hypothetical protein
MTIIIVFSFVEEQKSVHGAVWCVLTGGALQR